MSRTVHFTGPVRLPLRYRVTEYTATEGGYIVHAEIRPLPSVVAALVARAAGAVLEWLCDRLEEPFRRHVWPFMAGRGMPVRKARRNR
jgi:hypothetical protein